MVCCHLNPHPCDLGGCLVMSAYRNDFARQPATRDVSREVWCEDLSHQASRYDSVAWPFQVLSPSVLRARRACVFVVSQF